MMYVLLMLGLLITCVGVINFRGNIQSVHWYNRIKITEENKKPYSRFMGLGVIVIGISILVSSILDLILKNKLVYFSILVGCVIGVGLMIYAQLKYNEGIF